MIKSNISKPSTWLLAGFAGMLVGCTNQPSPVPANQSAKGATKASADSTDPAGKSASIEEHGHKKGGHGGIIASLGRDSYHVEAVFEKSGSVRLFTLGADESRVIDVEKQQLQGFLKETGGTDSLTIEFLAEPQPGDAKDRTSQFVGKLPSTLVGKAVEITIPNIVIAGERFRFNVQSQSEGQHEDSMPAKVADAEEQKLYLTPGGKYTEADIKANGSTVASVKFKGIKATHDLKPKPGEKLCPISMTKANPKFAWIIGGKTYEFCCPPCVDEFVALAKSNPELINPPEFYVKRDPPASAPSAKDAPAVTPTPAKNQSTSGETKQASNGSNPTPATDEVTLERAKLSSEDRAAVAAQEWCVVMQDSQLGSMGAPVKITIKGQSVYLCCASCKRKAEADPEKTLAVLAQHQAKVKQQAGLVR